MDSIQDKQEKVQNPVSEMKFSGFWRNHRVFGFDQTPKSSGNKKQQSSRFKFNYMIFLMFLKFQLSLEGQLSPLRILEAEVEVENPGCSDPMLDDDGVQQGKNVSLGKTMLAETFS